MLDTLWMLRKDNLQKRYLDSHHYFNCNLCYVKITISVLHLSEHKITYTMPMTSVSSFLLVCNYFISRANTAIRVLVILLLLFLFEFIVGLSMSENLTNMNCVVCVSFPQRHGHGYETSSYNVCCYVTLKR